MSQRQTWGEPHRQAVLVAPTPTGRRVLVTWLPSRDLRIGLRAGDMVVAEIFSLVQRQCGECGKLCGPDVIRCVCKDAAKRK